MAFQMKKARSSLLMIRFSHSSSAGYWRNPGGSSAFNDNRRLGGSSGIERADGENRRQSKMKYGPSFTYFILDIIEYEK